MERLAGAGATLSPQSQGRIKKLYYFFRISNSNETRSNSNEFCMNSKTKQTTNQKDM
jgi:hypothetical protein